jgi:hypothetical protein
VTKKVVGVFVRFRALQYAITMSNLNKKSVTN